MGARRRGFTSWFVEPYRQVRLGLVFLVVNFVFAALIFGVFAYYLWDVYHAMVSYFELSGPQGGEILSKLATPMLWGAGLILVFVITTILVSVRYTHAIYGPLVSIHRYLDDILEEKHVSPLALRDSDQLQDLAKKLNTVAERYVVDQRQSSLVPVYRFIDDLLQGKRPQPLEIRGSDHIQDLVNKLNKLADVINANTAEKR